MIRKFSMGALISVLAAVAHGADKMDVWVLLTKPPLAADANASEAIRKQQQSVLTQLHALGAVELGRVSVARNAIAVSIDPARLPEVKRIAGVRSVSPVRHIERDPPAPPPGR